MTSDHLRDLIRYRVALALALTAGILVPEATAEPILGTDLETADLVVDLPWSFEVTVEPVSAAAISEAEVRTTCYRYKSTAPVTEGAEGATYLRAELTALEHGSARLAEVAFDNLLAGADPAIGLSYAWDQLFLSGAVIYHLHAGCLLSEENFQLMVERLEAALRRRSPPDLHVAICRCGGGCQRLAALSKPTSRMIHRMQKTILSESAGWVLFSDGPNLVFANRGTSYRHVVIFVLGLITVILGANGIVWLVAGLRSGETSLLGIILFAVAGLAAFGASRFWAAETRDQAVIPARDTWVAVLDLETRTLETPEGESLAPLADIRFAPVMQLGSSSRALSAKWPEGSVVVYRGSPFAGSYQEALDALRLQGVETD